MVSRTPCSPPLLFMVLGDPRSCGPPDRRFSLKASAVFTFVAVVTMPTVAALRHILHDVNMTHQLGQLDVTKRFVARLVKVQFDPISSSVHLLRKEFSLVKTMATFSGIVVSAIVAQIKALRSR